MSNAILSVEEARNLSICLLDATDRIPGISDEARLALLIAAGLLAEHSCGAVIAQAETDQLLGRTNRLDGQRAEAPALPARSSRPRVPRFLIRLAASAGLGPKGRGKP